MMQIEVTRYDLKKRVHVFVINTYLFFIKNPVKSAHFSAKTRNFLIESNR